METGSPQRLQGRSNEGHGHARLNAHPHAPVQDHFDCPGVINLFVFRKWQGTLHSSAIQKVLHLTGPQSILRGRGQDGMKTPNCDFGPETNILGAKRPGILDVARQVVL